MANQIPAATTACPHTHNPAEAPALTETTMKATLVKKPSALTQEHFEALWNERIAADLDALAATEKAPRTPEPRAAAATTTTRTALAARLPMLETRYERVAGTLRLNDKGGVVSRHPALTPWVTFDPQSRDYSIDRYIDGPGLLALSRKVGAKVVFANATFTALAALHATETVIERKARRDAKREKAARLDAERAARAAAYARKEAERLERLEAQRAIARAERAKANAIARAAAKAERLEAQRLKEAAKAQRRAQRRNERAAAKAERKGAQPLSAAARRLLATLRALGGRMVPYAQRALARAQGGVGMAATVKALAVIAKVWGRYTTFDDDALEVLNEDFESAYALVLPTCERAAARAARPLNRDKGTPRALSLALTLARKVRG